MAGVEPRKDREWLRRKFRDIERRLSAAEAAPRVDATTGTGMGRPWLNLGTVGHADPTVVWQPVTTSTFQQIASSSGVAQHAHLLFHYSYWIPGTDTAEFRFRVSVIGGSQQGEDFYYGPVVKSGPNDGFGAGNVVPAEVDFSSRIAVALELRRASGAGTVNGNLNYVYGCGLRDNPYLPVLGAI